MANEELAAALNRLSSVLDKLDVTLDQFGRVADSVDHMSAAFRDVQKNAKRADEDRNRVQAMVSENLRRMHDQHKVK